MAQVSCARCGRDAEGLPRAPLSGQLGQDILANVCQSCWKDWQQESFRLINHLGLQPVDPADRQKLFGILREYLSIPARVS
jgi:Fe-S cluster biosynthesis and repair protein YggX